METPKKVAWKVKEWGQLVSLSESYVHKLIAEKRIESVRIGHTRLIKTPPEMFLEELANVHPNDRLSA